MLIYNTTFQVDEDVHDNFMIWIKESYIPEVQKHGALKAPPHLPDIKSPGRRKCYSFAMGGGKQRVTASLAFGTGSTFE